MKIGALGFIFRYQKSTLQCPRKSVSQRVCTLLVSIAVVPLAYPEDPLSEEQGKLVLAAVENAMDVAPEDNYFPSFLNNWFWRGSHVFHCRTQEDVNWLEEKVGGCVPWPGASLKTVIEMEDLIKLSMIIIFVPSKHDAGTVLKRLSRQNPDLKVNTWQVRGTKGVPAKKSDLEVETAMVVIMEGTEVDALKRINFQPFCGGFRAHCLVWKDRNAAKDGGTTENMEVNTPAPDKEERQGRDGGPSDDKGRSTTPKEDYLTNL